MVLKVSPIQCTGCGVCQQVCSFHNFKEINPKKSFLRLKREHVKDIVIVCTQCGLCAKNCPKGMIKKSKTVYKISKNCDGCGKCVKACPLKLIIIEKGKAKKCEGCLKCVEWCPPEAMTR